MVLFIQIVYLLCIVTICMTLCLIPLQFMPRPGSSQVSSAAASDVEMEGGNEQQHTLSRGRKRPPEDHADREWKRQKDSDTAGQHSNQVLLLMKLAEK